MDQSATSSGIEAIVLARSGDLEGARKSIAEFDSFTRTVKADLLARQGQKRQSDAIRQHLSTGIIHNLNNSYVDFFKGVGETSRGPDVGRQRY